MCLAPSLINLVKHKLELNVLKRTATTIRELIDQQAALQVQRQPDALYALATEREQTLPYSELSQRCQSVSHWLSKNGAHFGDTVSLVMPNGLATLTLLLGAMWGGRCVNPINLLSQADQMRYVLEHSDCKLIVVSPAWELRVREIVSNIERSIAVQVIDPDALQFADNTVGIAPQAVSPDATALLMYTSGTTGQPKGVLLTQANLVANAYAISEEHALLNTDRVLGVLPLYHINAFAVTMLAPLASGGSVAMAPKFSAARFWGQAIDCGCNWLNVVPTMISYLNEGQDIEGQSIEGQGISEAGSGFKFCRSASAALPPEHLLAFERKFGIGIIETMGLTETVAPSFSNPLNSAERKIGSVGKASGCEACIINANLQPVADGVIGEVAIRGPNVMKGYYKNEQATTSTFTVDGWLRTGDLGYRDVDGFFFVTGRIKELIIKGGENIAPREIDEVLLKHAAVLDAAAVGIPDKHYGQEIMACVIVREGFTCTEADITAHSLKHLGKYKTPKVIRFVSELPRGPSGKVQRLKLVSLL